MRKIKFRAWRPSNSAMMPANDLLQLLALSNKNSLFNPDEVLWMQFTGLTDKNDVEIYEGDVVKSTNNKHYWLYVVKTIPNFGGMLWACMYENNLSVCDIQDVYTYKKQRVKLGSRRDFLSCRVEVIGNIHENPELLAK